MAPIVAFLMEQGLSLLGNAVLAKGKEVVEDKLGIKLKPDATPEELAAYRRAEMEHEQFLIQAALAKEQIAQGNVTERWKADMLSDSWLSKNIRPMVLLYLLATYSILSLLSGFAFYVTEAYVELLAQMLMLVMGAYFAGRTLEKVVDMKERGK